MLLNFPRNSEGSEAGEHLPDYGTSPRKEGRVTYRQFMEMTERSDARYELIDGEVFLLASPGFTHQQILGKLHIIFHEYFRENEDCDALMAPFDVELMRQKVKLLREATEDDISIVQPDLLVICDYLKDINEKDRYKGTPSLTVEILSPSTRSKDRLKKLDLYMESGVGEGWLIDPQNKTVEVYFFKDGEIESNRIYTSAQTAESVLFPGLRVPAGPLFDLAEQAAIKNMISGSG
jgi:Uma2 family endonuclease